MIERRRYIAGDCGLIGVREDVADDAAALGDLLAGGVPPGEAWTITSQGFVLGVAGLVPVWPGRLSAWSYIGKVRPAVWGGFKRHVAEILDAAFAAGARRIDAQARADFPAAQRCLEWMGFEPEGLARCWGPDGADYVLYGRINPSWR